MNIFEKLLKIQNDVKAKKDMTNEFGHFNYRNAERIYNSAKPTCEKYGAVLRMTDEVVEIGGKLFVKAIAELIDIEMQGEIYAISSVGWARIPEQKKGMDDSQLTGSASSYANKYAISALLLLDDNKDPDALPPDDKYDQIKEKEEAMNRNQNKLDAEENWRLFGGVVLIKASDGKFYELNRLSKKQLQSALTNEKFAGIRDFIEAEIAKK